MELYNLENHFYRVEGFKMDIHEREWGACTGLIWLRTGINCGLLHARKWIFGFLKMQGICRLAEEPLAFQELLLICLRNSVLGR